jgi:hypothetical protein
MGGKISRGLVATLVEDWVAKLVEGLVVRLVTRLLVTASYLGSIPDIP